MTKVLITGGSGLVGNHLCNRLQEKGYIVSILSRFERLNSSIETFTWNWENDEIEEGAFENIDYIIHLAGANIGQKRWTKKRKQLIIESRSKSGELIFRKVREMNIHLKAFITGSAIGYYGAVTSDKIFVEEDYPGNDFLGNTCMQWEQKADNFSSLGIRTVKIRTGIVLSKHGGVLSKMKIPINMNIGSAIGDGKQYLPWIHIDDLCGIYIKAIEDDKMKGAYNAIAPEHITNYRFTKKLAHALHKSLWLMNVPSFIMKFVFGEMAVLLLKGSRVSSDKIIRAGYKFQYTTLKNSLEDVVGSNY